MRLKIIEDGRDKLVNLANALQEGVEERTREELIDLSNKVLFNKGNVLSIAQMLYGIDDPILSRAQTALDEANEAANNSCAQITSLQKILEFLNLDSEAGSTTEG